jgi:MFS family permease
VSRRTIALGAIGVHLGIGSVYAWSTLNLPIIAAMPSLPRWLAPPYSTFTTALVLLALSSALLGPWVERRGPRVAARTAAVCFSSGLALGGLAVVLQQPLLLVLGLGILCGIGCGIGYIAPVSTLLQWFPGRRGLATGLAIMGFGGGAFLGGCANAALIAAFGVAGTLFLLAGFYLVLMLAGAQLLRPPPPAAQAALTAPSAAPEPAPSGLSRRQAIRQPQFALLWGMLCINVTAGIGILAQASPMMQDLFGKTPAEAAAVVALISLANAGGRLFWSSLSDLIGRRTIFLLFFAAQALLFLLIPRLAAAGAWWPFLACLLLVFTMYGGGFATIPAYLADIFGTRNVAAIYGSLLTAWGAAAILGPVLITQLAARAKAALPPGGATLHIYDQPLAVLAALLACGVLLTLAVRPLRLAPPGQATAVR